ncbi:protein YIPF1 homolog isoform X2 [Arachis ipaensis]|uniref:protein YIPF1 homolog isoform X2 n=1 Tax=Arachis ipaensis TaxID=130454 RepID=UPI000A2B8B3B|nr:protein YIPF1 homolog isoform X2 [Arachis ipaensis]
MLGSPDNGCSPFGKYANIPFQQCRRKKRTSISTYYSSNCCIFLSTDGLYQRRKESFEQQPTTNWQGVFSVSSYSQYFNVDTDVVVDRMICSLNPVRDDFFSKIDANPDLYGTVWISTTLVFILSSVGNLATYFSVKKANDWNFDVSYVHSAAWSIYGYVLVVPMAYHFYLQYMRSNTNLVRFWCLWGYSLTIFVMSSFLLLIPVGVLRWMIIITSGGASATFVALNLKSFIQENDLSMAVIAAFGLQIALAVFIKVRFFA